MYNRPKLMSAAQARLAQGGRWMAVLICFLAGLLGGGASAGGSSFNVNLDLDDSSLAAPPSFGSDLFPGDILSFLTGFVLVFVSVALLITAAYFIFVGNVISVGFHGWFLRYVRGEQPPVQDLFLAFRIYLKSVVTMLLRDVYTWLWSLLFVIPGIIKSYSYYLVPYIIYENPELSADEAITLSRKMMDGWKWNAFLLELGFLGWRILGAFTLGILDILYVNPYYRTAHAMFYESVRYDALYVRHVVTPEELAVEADEYTVPSAPSSFESDPFYNPENTYEADAVYAAPTDAEPYTETVAPTDESAPTVDSVSEEPPSDESAE